MEMLNAMPITWQQRKWPLENWQEFCLYLLRSYAQSLTKKDPLQSHWFSQHHVYFIDEKCAFGNTELEVKNRAKSIKLNVSITINHHKLD